MKGPTYIEFDPNLDKYREHCYEVHQKKLREISAPHREYITKAKHNEQDDLLARVNINKFRAHEFVNAERDADIKRRNQLLLDKLVEISHGKWSSVGKGKKSKKSKPNIVLAPGPRSLNYFSRKRESQRIESENVAFAKRLIDKKGALSKRVLESDFKVHSKYKKLISKTSKLGGTRKFQSKGDLGKYNTLGVRSVSNDPNLKREKEIPHSKSFKRKTNRNIEPEKSSTPLKKDEQKYEYFEDHQVNKADNVDDQKTEAMPPMRKNEENKKSESTQKKILKGEKGQKKSKSSSNSSSDDE